MTAVIFCGHVQMTYPGFIDIATGRTLTCDPGQEYDVIPVGIAAGDVPNDGRFIVQEPPGDESPADKRRRVPQDTTTTAPDEMKED